MMILRIWRGWTSHDRPHDYPKHFRNIVKPELASVTGFLGADLSRRAVAEGIEFTVITRWASMDAIRAFAGDDVGRAVVEPGAVAALTRFDSDVEHHEVIDRV